MSQLSSMINQMSLQNSLDVIEKSRKSVSGANASHPNRRFEDAQCLLDIPFLPLTWMFAIAAKYIHMPVTASSLAYKSETSAGHT